MFLAGLFFGTYDGFKNLFPNVSNNTAPLVHLCAGIVGEVVYYILIILYYFTLRLNINILV